MTKRHRLATVGVDSSFADKIAERTDGLAEALRFEEILSEISATFVRITAEKIDHEIEGSLRQVVLAMDFDRAAVGEINPDDGMLYVTHQWSREGLVPVPKTMDLAATLPWLTAKVLADEIVNLSRLEDAPPEAAKDVEFGRLMGNKSVLTFPLKIGGAIVGVVSFGSIRSERSCSERDLQRMRLVAEVFGNALERKRAVAQIRRLDREMHQISRVAMMGELTVSLAHELNQPLGAILNNAQAARRLLSSEQPDLEEIGAALDDIVRDNSRAVEIVKQVRALFQKGEVQKTSVDLRQILLDIETLLRNEAMVRGISFRLTDPESLPTVRGQSTQLMQLLLNLSLNAFDAICESESPKREVEIHAVYEQVHDRVRVSVRDSGKGIDPADIPRLFDAFFTTKKNGIGLGLAIAQSIVQNHGGQLWAVQNPDQGATMIFEIPVAK